MAFKFDDLIAKVKSQIPKDLMGKFMPKGKADGAGEKTSTKAAKTVPGTETLTDPDKTTSKTLTKSQIAATKTDGAAPAGKDGKPPLDPKAAKRSKIIKIVVGIVLICFVADEFLNPEQPKQAAQDATTQQAPKKKKKKAAEAPTPAPEQAQAVATPTPAPQPEQTPMQAEVPVPTPTASPEVVQQAVQQPVVEATPAVATADPTSSPTPAAVSGATQNRNPSAGPDSTATTASNSDASAFQIGEKTPQDQVKEAGPSEGHIDKVLDQLETQKEQEYVAPPTYEELGRGLVYNCKGKHWACINKDAYFKCRDNLKWNTAHSKPIECSTVNVYATNEDCELIQIHNINTREKTDFCK